MIIKLLLSGLAFLSAATIHAATFYVDPVNGSMSGDGSQANPWSTLQAVFDNNLIESEEPVSKPYSAGEPLKVKNSGAPVKPGDTIKLLSGDHGTINLYAWYNPQMITIEAAAGETPVLRSWSLQGGRNWKLKGLTISPEPYGTPNGGTLARFVAHGHQGPASECVIEDCHLYTVDDASGWSATDWTGKAAHGIDLGGPNMTGRGNVVRNVANGISTASHALVEYNEVDGFRMDGLRGMGDYSVFQYNVIKNNFNVDGNHDDAFQSWANNGGGPGSGVRYGIELRGNIIIETTDTARPFQGPLQGIGLFDGMFEDWIVENNLIAIDQWNGITFGGATNCKILNNTVIDLGLRSNRPRIVVSPHKNGTPSTGNIVRNNIAREVLDHSNGGVTASNNISIDIPNYGTYFVDYLANDYRLKAGSPAIDAGTSTDAPAEDNLGILRPQGGAVDVGAYEFSGQSPYNGAPFLISSGTTRIELEEYDLGGQGVAYSDTTSDNVQNGIRQDEGVDNRVSNDSAGGNYTIGYTEDGEWLEYTVDVMAGVYDISLRVASGSGAAGDVEVLIGDGSSFSALHTFDVQYTGGWSHYTTLTASGVSLPGGQQVLRLNLIGGSTNLNWIEFVRVSGGGPVNFNDGAFSGYNGSQDGSGTETILHGGDGLRLTGNRWREMTHAYTVTANTLLEVHIDALDQGELLGIGFDNDNEPYTGIQTLFKIGGSDSAPGAWIDFASDYYSCQSGGDLIVIPVGEYYTGNMDRLAFVADDDADASANVTFSELRILEGRLIDFDDYALSAYSNQDGSGGHSTSAMKSEGGVTVNLQGNVWKRIPLTYNVTANTVLEFEVALDGSDSSEMVLIGFDDNNVHDDDMRLFQLAGTQTWAKAYQEANDYTSGTVNYQIAVGQFYTGSMNHLCIAGDDDSSGGANIEFKNIRIYEE